MAGFSRWGYSLRSLFDLFAPPAMCTHAS